VEGKRVKHFKPLSLLIVLATLYGVMYHYFHISAVPELDQGQIGVNKVFLEKLNDWLGSHLVLVNLLSIPIYTLGSYFTFKKQGYNLIEHFVLNTYYIGQRLFLIILTFPITLYLNKAHHLIIFSRIQLVINFILMVWVYAQFFNKSDFFRTLFNALLTYLAFWLVFGLVVVAAVQELS
jgi:hypothetical protein